MERIRIETLSRTHSATSPSGTVSVASSQTWPAEYISFPAEGRERYQSLDGKVSGEFRFNGSPTISLRSTRFVWVTKGHPNYLKIYYPVKPPDNVDGVGRLTSVVVEDRGEVADA